MNSARCISPGVSRATSALLVLVAVDRAEVAGLAPERQLVVGELVRVDRVARLDRPALGDRARQVQAQRVAVLLVDRDEGGGLLVAGEQERVEVDVEEDGRLGGEVQLAPELAGHTEAEALPDQRLAMAVG